ncbi:hypothetical protein DCC85_01475 [Paenibacillus sp. CAA11]|uniref:hypothetical protein n=1 Tax=Paenibacillus sp. CAA11 TaxID=1532905 RepID=UPI000D3B986D|nr:hypothetical protein [Paenibacillus sp. CAA11]AWB43030.1 hypothetical protein DCC85_01475 [Paenibacillus sp. CAA11]
MNTRLVLVEGLPGFGKSTIARLMSEVLTEQGMKVRLFEEGNLEHPADYDGTSYFTDDEFAELISEFHASEEFEGLLQSWAVRHGGGWLLPYRKLLEGAGSQLPEELVRRMAEGDIYELPFKLGRELITEKWRRFGAAAAQEDCVYIFDCCFIQNPATLGMIKYDAPKEEVAGFVMDLAEAVKALNPLLIYVNRDNLEAAFLRAVKERPEAWSEGFIPYYTEQGYGRRRGLRGLEGTLEVLKSRREFELELIEQLEMNKVLLNNSQADLHAAKLELTRILPQF